MGGKVEKCSIDLFKIPWVMQINLMQANLSAAELGNIIAYLLRHAEISWLIQKFEPVNGQIRLLAQSYRRSPFIPTICSFTALIQNSAQHTNNDSALHLLIQNYK